MDYEWLDLQLFHLEDADWYDADIAEVELPFAMKAHQFLLNAQRHLRQGRDDTRLVDALTNAKRALECRCDELLFVFGLYTAAKRRHWSLPKKLDVLAYLGLPAPRILRLINRFRNIAEHDFKPPNAAALADFLDAAVLFLDSTWWYINNFADDVTFTDSNCEGDSWRVHLDRDLSQFAIERHNVEGTIERGTLGLQDRQYLPYLQAYLALIFDRQWIPWIGGDRPGDVQL